MEEPNFRQPPTDTTVQGQNSHRSRRVVKHHGRFHLHRSQRRLLLRVVIFTALVVVLVLAWYRIVQT